MNCDHCGARIPAHAKVCPECGKSPWEEINTSVIAQENEEEKSEEEIAASHEEDSFNESNNLSDQIVSDEEVPDGDDLIKDDTSKQTAENEVVSDDNDVLEEDGVEQDIVESSDTDENQQSDIHTDELGQSEQPEHVDEPEQPEEVDEPKQPEQLEKPEEVDEPEQLEQIGQSEQTEQLEQVDEPEQPGRSDTPVEPEQVNQPKIVAPSQVNTKAVVAAVIIVVLLAAIVVGVVWYVVANNNSTQNNDDEQIVSFSEKDTGNTGSNNFGNVLGEAVFGSSEEVTVADDTFIMPQDLSGNSFEVYTVRAMAQSNPDENADRTRYVSALQTASGFMLSEVFDDLPEGLYSIVIETTDGKSYVMPLVNYVADRDLSYSGDEAPVELAVRPSTYDGDKSEKAQQACTLYYAKCLEYEELYGSRSNVSLYLTIADEDSDPIEITPLLGFCSANVVDFNEDGLDELVVVYYSDDMLTAENNSEQDDSVGNASHYIVEVWEYDTGSIHRIYQGIPFVETRLGQVVAAVVSWEDQMYLLGGTSNGNDLNLLLYGYTEGALESQHAIEVFEDQGSATLDSQNIDDGWLAIANQMNLVWSEDMVYISDNSASSFYKTLRDIRRIAGVAPASINDESAFGYVSNLPDSSVGNDADESLQGLTDDDSFELLEDNESDYILPDESTRYYDKSELEDLSDFELYLSFNEIYARYGRGFESDDLQEYFDNKSWYEQRYTADEFDAMESPLNAYEKANADLIREIEQERGSSYF